MNAVALYGPRSTCIPPTNSPSNLPSPGRSSPDPNDFALEVKKRYAPRTTLVWVFSPLVQRLINEGASTVLFECRSYLAGSGVAREVREPDSGDCIRSVAVVDPRSPYGKRDSSFVRVSTACPYFHHANLIFSIYSKKTPMKTTRTLSPTWSMHLDTIYQGFKAVGRVVHHWSQRRCVRDHIPPIRTRV